MDFTYWILKAMSWVGIASGLRPFRRIAADFAKVEIADTALTRDQWKEALEQANLAHRDWGGSPRARFAPDPRASLFHIT